MRVATVLRYSWRLLAFLRPFKGRVLLAVLLGTMTIASSIGLLATSAWLISAAALETSLANLGVAIVGVRFFGISRGVFRYAERLISHSVTFRLLAQLRVWFYAALEPLAPARLMGYQSGDLLGRIVTDIGVLENFYVRVVAPPLIALVVGAGAIALLLYFDILLALALAVFLLLAGLVLPGLALWSTRGPGRRLVDRRVALQTGLVDGIQGMADLQAYGQTARVRGQIQKESRALMQEEERMAWLGGLYGALNLLLGNLAMVTVLLLAIPMVGAGQLEGVNLAVVTLAALAAFEAVQPLPLAAQQLEGSVQAARRLFEILDAEPAIPEPEITRALQPDHVALSVQGLRFRYGPDEPWALDGIDFSLNPGRRLAIVGPSGAGKSTLVNVLLHFWPYQEGQVLLNGWPMVDWAPEDVRRLYGIAAQDSHVFNATVRDNIRIADPQASAEAILAAAAQAQLKDVVAGLPEGYETVVGELGQALSGGQRQRLILARAMLPDPPVLVLDEPTANLDPLTERAVLQTVFGLARGRALLLITHRLVGMDAMDEILVMDKGQIVQRGRHDDLVRQDGLYRRLWQLQNRHILNEPAPAID
ncbi:MAG: thiol reductant ABC exporter subunit CydC [Candidatus Promineifilaceae bacterium]|nr:thiol reductant ABC exporter subunit CydC [Candidatus Promineifilaceae bacterium]